MLIPLSWIIIFNLFRDLVSKYNWCAFYCLFLVLLYPNNNQTHSTHVRYFLAMLYWHIQTISTHSTFDKAEYRQPSLYYLHEKQYEVDIDWSESSARKPCPPCVPALVPTILSTLCPRPSARHHAHLVSPP